MLIKIRKAQSTAEYAILFAIVIAAALGVQNRVRKALQARVYDATVDFVRETDGRTLQWESTESTKTTIDQHSEEKYVEDYESENPFHWEEEKTSEWESISYQ